MFKKHHSGLLLVEYESYIVTKSGIFFFVPRHVILKGISSQMQSASDRVNAGLPTCMAASTLIGIGTSHGFVLVFDISQVSPFPPSLFCL